MEIRANQYIRLASTDQVGSSPATGGTAAPAGRSQVQVSNSAQQIAQLHQQVENAPDVRSDKVEALKSQIANGTYKVDLDRLAGFMARALK